MHKTLASLSLSLTFAVAAASSLAPAQPFTTIGVGGRIEQQLGVFQTNGVLASNGSVLIAHAGADRRIFVRFFASSNRSVTGFDLNMRFTMIQEVVDAWLYTADAQNRPLDAVVSGQIGVDTTMRYCRASFSAPFQVQAGSAYFVAFTLPAFQDLLLANVVASGALATTYFVTASGSAQTAGIQLRINADGHSPHCTTDQPRFGNVFTVRCIEASFNQPGALWITFAEPGSPVSLAGLGGGGFWYLGSAAWLAAIVPGDPDRSREVTLFWPPASALDTALGQPLRLQWQLANGSSGTATSDMALTTVR